MNHSSNHDFVAPVDGNVAFTTTSNIRATMAHQPAASTASQGYNRMMSGQEQQATVEQCSLPQKRTFGLMSESQMVMTNSAVDMTTSSLTNPDYSMTTTAPTMNPWSQDFIQADAAVMASRVEQVAQSLASIGIVASPDVIVQATFHRATDIDGQYRHDCREYGRFVVEERRRDLAA